MKISIHRLSHLVLHHPEEVMESDLRQILQGFQDVTQHEARPAWRSWILDSERKHIGMSWITQTTFSKNCVPYQERIVKMKGGSREGESNIAAGTLVL